MSFSDMFVYVPFAVYALLLAVFVLRCRFGVKVKIVWAAVLLLALSKHWCFMTFGSSAFNPEFPAVLVVAWDAAFVGAVVLCVLSSVLFFRFPYRDVALPFASWSVAALGVWCGVAVPGVKEVRLRFPALPSSLEGYRIVQISDLHCSSAARKWRTEAVVDAVNRLDADLVCLTGDYVDGEVRDRGDDLKPLAEISARDGVYYVTGNHEYYRDGPGWAEWFRGNGMRFLSNECVFPHKGLALGGVNDFAGPRFGAEVPDVRHAFRAATNGEFRVLLQHRPKAAADNIREVGVDLQLSGHTHGGVAPGIRRLVAGYNGGFSRGAYRIGSGVLYVSAGTGQWAGFLSRVFNPSEITLITLSRGDAVRGSLRD